MNRKLATANDSFRGKQSPARMARREAEAEAAIEALIRALGIPLDTNTKKTAGRVARSMVRDSFRGLYDAPPRLTLFESDRTYDQVVTIGPITVHSTCSHHLLPFMGQAYIGVLYGEQSLILGLSKFSRVVDWFARRPQLQEDLTQQIADYLNDKLAPDGVGVHINAKHLCACSRGVKETNMTMQTTVLKGALLESASAKDEFLRSITRT